MIRYCAFDLEIAKAIPEGTETWHDLRPLGISCAAISKVAYDPDSDERYEYTRTYHGYMTADARYADQLTPRQCRSLANDLMTYQGLGFTLVTFNGCGFDLDVLAEECQDDASARSLRALARAHVDIAFAMFAEKGFMCGLEKAAKGMDLGGKTEGMSGALAPREWAEGDQELVLDYVTQDAVLTGKLYEAVLENKSLCWITRRGKRSAWWPAKWGKTAEGARRLLTVSEAQEQPEPDTSWMDNPWPREKFTGWLEG